jgi:phenylalanyl-tRNA synthetase beta chain
MVPYAGMRAALLIQELAGGTIVGKVQEFYPEKIAKKRIELDYGRMESLIGKALGKETIEGILNNLGYEFESKSDNGSVVLAPYHMVDVYRECDVVEEVLRIYGYNNIELPSSVRMSINATPKPDPEEVRMKILDFLAANGFMECMNNSLTKGDYYQKLKTFPAENSVNIINPLSSDLNVMRQTLLFSGLEVVAYNLNRQASSLKFFELGNVYSFEPKEDEENPVNSLRSYKEGARLSMFISGKATQYWRNSVGEGHFFTLKGYLELLFKKMGVDIYSLEAVPAPGDIFAEGIEYLTRGGKKLAIIGTVAPARLKTFGIKQPVFAAEVNWDLLFDLYKKNKVKYKELPKFPEVKRDFALLLDENVTFAQIRQAAFNTERKLLKQVSLFDVYRGNKIPEGKKQYAVSFVLQDPDKTLTDQYVEQVMTKLLNSFMKQFGATLR